MSVCVNDKGILEFLLVVNLYGTKHLTLKYHTYHLFLEMIFEVPEVLPRDHRTSNHPHELLEV